MASLLEPLGFTLLHFLWQGALIAVLLFLVLLFVKRSGTRYVLACAALLLMLCAPVLTFLYLSEPVFFSIPDANYSITDETLDVVVDTDVALSVVEEEGQPRGVAPVGGVTWYDKPHWRERVMDALPYFVWAWFVGVVVLSLRLLLQWLYAERFKRRHTRHAADDMQKLLRTLALRLCISRPVQLLESSLVDAPTVIGFLKPVILLPTSALTGLSTQQLESLLAHELAHIRRHDYLVNILQSVIETLLFYQPAVWWVSRQIRIEREHCCDDVAVSISGSALTYARALERLETLRSQPGLSLAASDGKLISRVKRVLGKPEQSPNWFVGSFIIIALFALLVFIDMPEVIAQQNVTEHKSSSTDSTVWGLDASEENLTELETSTTFMSPLEYLPHLIQKTENTVPPLNTFEETISTMTSAERRGLHGILNESPKGYLWATLYGDVKLSKGYTELERTETPESYLQLEERKDNAVQSVIVKKYQENPIEYFYTVNGLQQPFDAEAQACYEDAFYEVITRRWNDHESSLSPLDRLGDPKLLASSGRLIDGKHYSLIVAKEQGRVPLQSATQLKEDGTKTITYFTNDEALLALDSAFHYAAHDLLAASPSAHDEMIKTFVLDIAEHAELEKSGFRELFLVINEMKSEGAKRDLLQTLTTKIPEALSLFEE
ncbi:MAG: M56 family metallopeptidase [Trueperaceae bacterium]